MKKRPIRLCLMLAVVLLMTVGAVSCRSQTNQVQQQFIEVKRGDIVVTVAADGNLSLIRDRQLTFGTSGTITEINVAEGDLVSEGQVLARLDTKSIELATSNAALDTKSMELAVGTAALVVKMATFDLEIASDAYKKITYPYTYYTFAISVPESLAAIADAQLAIRNAQKVLATELTPEQYTEIQIELKKAQDRLIIAQEKLYRGQGYDPFISGQLSVGSFWTLRDAQLAMEKAQTGLEKANNDLQKAQVGLEKANNDLQKAKDELPKAVITAPFSGLIALVSVKVGDKLSAQEYNSQVICELIEPGRFEIKTTVDEIDIARVAVGQKAIISLDALPDTKPEGSVTYISPLSKTEGGVVVYEVKISLTGSGINGLKSGMTAKADIITQKRTNVLLIPERAVYKNSAGDIVVKVYANEKTTEKTVSTGISDGIQTEVLSGLGEGEVVVIERKVSAS